MIGYFEAAPYTHDTSNAKSAVIPKELISRLSLLVNIIPNCVVSIKVSTTIFCNSHLVRLNFSCAMSDNLFNSFGIQRGQYTKKNMNQSLPLVS